MKLLPHLLGKTDPCYCMYVSVWSWSCVLFTPIHHTIMSNNHTEVLKAIASLKQDVNSNTTTLQTIEKNTTTTATETIMKNIAAVISVIIHLIILALQLVVIVLAFFKQNNIHWTAEVITAFSYFAISPATVLQLIILWIFQSNC